ncbi:outer membrane protein transport protein [Vibrio sp. YMD68]|uniref:OmpP1/FadL family transporter n=1 Tax=Vibrio sp. YMD68 TaxID=3042300 RepID=UPI00249BBAC8|nr:outer membrane protein transport protein [Vibrio sp. YMD68]WGV98549.1 outer membrane protein transport protein [Vibrio sp. YMD68]
MKTSMSRALPKNKMRSAIPLFTLSLLSAAVLSTTSAQASGFFMQEAIIANTGTTGAGDGVYTQSAAAMWTNPATMSHMGESMTTVNTLLLDLEMNYADADQGESGKAHTLMPSVGVFHARQLNDDVHLGLALGTVGGSSVDYGSDWAGRNLMTDTTLTAVQFNPSLSFRVTDQVSWGIGAQFSWASLEMGMASGNVQLESSSDWAYGFNVGVMYKQSEKLDLGFSFRSKVEHDFSTNISGPGDINPAVASELAVPAIIDVSASYAATNQLNILASIQLHRWSEWDQTVFDFGKLNNNPIGLNSINRDWDDVWKFALGADYQLNSDWRLKAGFSYETSPQDDPSKQWVDLPVGDQYRYSVGASTTWDDYTFDVFYEYADLGSVDIAERSIANTPVGINGTFDGRIHFVGMSVTF